MFIDLDVDSCSSPPGGPAGPAAHDSLWVAIPAVCSTTIGMVLGQLIHVARDVDAVH